MVMPVGHGRSEAAEGRGRTGMPRFRLREAGAIPEGARGPEGDARRIALAVRKAGGRALVVGGYVRDVMLAGSSAGEPDLEVFGLPLAELGRTLRRFGRVRRIGRAFPVLRVGNLPVEVALPRRESKTGPGHRGFEAAADPHLSFPEAARRRDLTVNSMGLDPLTGELFDPYRGTRDLAAGLMRATDRDRFPEDPLRGLRAAAFAARFGFEADAELVRLCAALDLSELSAERIRDELEKLLLAPEPSRGFRLLAETGLLRFLPEVAALRGTPQNPRWHPEGDVFEHTLLALDQAAGLPVDDPEARRVFLFAVLCHDLGKPPTTRLRKGRITSHGHEAVGAGIARRFLERLRLPRALVAEVEALTRRHLAPGQFPRQNSGPGAYRRLARELAAAGTNLETLHRVALADNLGRTTRVARSGCFPDGEIFRERAEALGVFRQPPGTVVRGRHLLARGLAPGPEVGRLLGECRRMQDETGETDPERILDQVLEPAAPPPAGKPPPRPRTSGPRSKKPPSGGTRP